MAFFKKEPAAVRMAADITRLNERRNDLTTQLVDAKSTTTTLISSLHELLISSDSAQDEIAEAEAKLADTERRVSALTSALVALDRRIEDAKAELAEIEASEAADQAAADLDRDHAEFAIKLAALVFAAEALLPVATKVGERVTSGKEIEALARAIVAQLPPAARRIEDETKWTRELIVRERPSRLVKVERAA